jgi:DNA-binding Lrp family transcriptional regulator
MKYLQNKKVIENIRLDLKDKKILSILANNSRMPLTQISKRVALSRDAVSYRINNYEQAGIIQGYRTLVDISKLGYSNYHLFIKLNNPAKENEEKIILRLIKIPNIRAILKFNGNFDLEIALIVKDLQELDGLITKITNDCAGFIQEYELLALVKNYVSLDFPKSFTDNVEVQKRPITKKYNPDKKDIEILKIIGEDATLNLSKIGDKIHLSADAVNYRIKKLIESGIIIKFIPVLNYDALDFNLHAVLLNINSFNEESEKKLQEFLEVNKNTLWAVKCIGRFNILIYFLTKNTQEIQETLIELRSLFPKQINLYESLTAYEEYKYVYFPKELF